MEHKTSAQGPALLVLAAGMGSRYGGLKQIDPISSHGETILDFSVYDALEAGFEKIVLLITRALEPDFEATVGQRLRRQTDIHYAYQEKSDLPEGFTLPPDRVKPWGTGHALWAARDVIDRPFAVINADDFYGKQAFQTIHRFLTSDVTPKDYAMVSYRLDHTLTDHGTVARGVCEVRDGLLQSITERRKIAKMNTGAASGATVATGATVAFTEDDGQTWTPLPIDTPVSMQLFGFHPSIMDYAGRYLVEYLQEHVNEPTREYLLPGLLGEMLSHGEATVRVLQSSQRWFGVTYAQDKPYVMAAIERLRAEGAYPEVLWKD